MDLTFQEHRNIPIFLCSIALYSIRLYFHHQSHPHLGIVSLWLCLFILSGIISPLFSSGILGIYWPGSSSFSVISLLFPTVHGVLKARILKWFAIPFSTGPHFVRTLHHDLSILGGPTWHVLQFPWVRQGCGSYDQFDSFSVIVVFILPG